MKIRTTVTLIAFGIMVSLAWQAKANSPIFFGDPLPALTTDQLNQFEAGKDEFVDVEDVDRGLGPVFNGKSCAECHSSPHLVKNPDRHQCSVPDIRSSLVSNYRRGRNGAVLRYSGRKFAAASSCEIVGSIRAGF